MENEYKVGDTVVFAKAIRKGSDYVIEDREGEIITIDGDNYLIEFDGVQYKKTLDHIREKVQRGETNIDLTKKLDYFIARSPCRKRFAIPTLAKFGKTSFADAKLVAAHGVSSGRLRLNAHQSGMFDIVDSH